MPEETVTQMWLDKLREEWTRPYREALLELHNAGLALVPHMPPIHAPLSIRWDEAMGAADELLSGASPSSDVTKEDPS